MSTATANKPKTGSKTSEIIVGAAAAKLSAAVVGFKNASVEIEKLATLAEQQSLIIVNNEDKLALIDQETKNKAAQAKLDLGIQFESDRKAFVDTWLHDNGFVLITATDKVNLVQSLEEAIQTKEQEVKTAVAAAVGSANRDFTNEKKILELTHQQKEAANVAEINQLKQQNAFLEAQVKEARLLLESQMKNETERAKYAQIGTMNVGTPSNR